VPVPVPVPGEETGLILLLLLLLLLCLPPLGESGSGAGDDMVINSAALLLNYTPASSW
jgi:hypothetical protein